MPTIELPVNDRALAEPERLLEDGRALCLSGGGYRAMLFHLGVLWRLNEWGMLPTLARVSSVSGGSITAATLGMTWGELRFVDGIATNFVELVVKPIRRLSGKTLDAGVVIKGALLPGSASKYFARALRDHLFGKATLQDLPVTPRFVINATNLQTGKLWRFSRPYMADWTIGRVLNPRVQLAASVAASAAFPPILSPAILKVDPKSFERSSKAPNRRPEFMSRMILSDGGVYDNLGLETAFKRYRTLLVSDAGMRPDAIDAIPRGPIGQVRRVLDVVDSQVRALRKRQLLSCFELKQRNGSYWSTNSDITHYSAPATLPCPVKRTGELATLPTRLAKLTPELQERLINWGYAISDAAMRTWVDPKLSPPARFPYVRGV